MPAKSLFDDPDHWRKRSEEMRSLTDGLQNAEIKAAFLELADSYDSLAERAEMRMQQANRKADGHGAHR